MTALTMVEHRSLNLQSPSRVCYGISVKNIRLGDSWDVRAGLRHHYVCIWPSTKYAPCHQQPSCWLFTDRIISKWHKHHITQYTYCITVTEQTMLERGREVGIPLVLLQMANLYFHSADALWFWRNFAVSQRDYNVQDSYWQQRQMVSMNFKLAQTPHISPSKASYRASVITAVTNGEHRSLNSHKHPISHPERRAVECLLQVFWRKLADS